MLPLSLESILTQMSPDYREELIRKLMILQRTAGHAQEGAAVQGAMITVLSDVNVVKKRAESLSPPSVALASLLSAMRGIALAKEISILFKEGDYEKALSECIDRMILFALPSPRAPETIALPLEYMMMPGIRINRNIPTYLSTSMRHYPGTLFRIMAETIGIQAKGKAYPMAAAVYLHILSNADALVSSLSNKEREIFRSIVANEGLISLKEFIEKYRQAGSDQRYSQWYYYGSQDELMERYPGKDSQPYVNLFRKGLLILASDTARRGSVIAVPSEVYFQLGTEGKGRNKQQAESTMEFPEGEKLHERGSECLTEIRKIMVAIMYLSTNRMRTGVDKIASLTGCDQSVIRYSLDIMTANAWIGGKPTKLIVTGTGIDTLSRTELFAGTVFATINSSSLHLAGRGDGDSSVLKMISDFAIRALQRQDRPIRVSGLIGMLKNETAIREVHRLARVSEIERRENMYYYSNNSSEGKLRDIDTFLGEYVPAMLSLYYYAGILSASGTEIVGETFIRVSELGKRLYSKGAEAYVTEHDVKERDVKIIMQPNMDALVPLGIEPKTLMTICRFAELKSIDRICRFQITKKSLTAAINDGLTVKMVNEYLTGLSSTGIPDSLMRQLRDLEGREGEIEIYRCGGIIRVRDKFLLEELMRKRELQDLLDMRLDDTTVVVKAVADIRYLETVLKKAGFIPGRARSRAAGKEWHPVDDDQEEFLTGSDGDSSDDFS
jgi:hypothetical protein